MKTVVRTLVLVALASMASGCKLAVLVGAGGEVVSLSGTRDCAGPDFCEFDITDSSFSDSFTAMPRPGYTFVKWQDGSGFFCGNSTDPVCTVEMPNEDVGDALIATFSSGSIRPIFSAPEGLDTDGDGVVDDVDADDDNDGVLDGADNCPLDGPNNDGTGCPVVAIQDDDTVLVYDKRWVQPILFAEKTWHQIAAACPPPTGVCDGAIYSEWAEVEFDLSGWTWGSAVEVSTVLDVFLGTSLGAVPDWHYQAEAELSPNIFEYFFAHNACCTVDSVWGWTRDEANVVEAHPYGVSCSDLEDDSCYNLRAGAFAEGAYIPKTESEPVFGAWLYRLE